MSSSIDRKMNDVELAGLKFTSWNRIGEWLRRIDGVRQIA